ncbi:type IV secretion system lipoprotein VirB7 [Acidiphilium sp.]|uniref:type IV secretion system lipoprotein VirB7 n=1 Tax=Acidiphilium sp. TaxID=527 RepID=UPI003D0609E8
MIRLALVVTLAGLLAGCASSDPLAHAHGPVFALNAGRWQPAPSQLRVPPRVPHS